MDAHPNQSAADLHAEPSPPVEHQNTKKRKTTSSSRGVNSLTPEQLAKKRANDREAQRAIRERTKAQIEGLERRIKELTSQQPYQELQSVLRQKELVQAENEDIKKRLLSILSIIQPILGIQGLSPSLVRGNTNVLTIDFRSNGGEGSVGHLFSSPTVWRWTISVESSHTVAVLLRRLYHKC